MADEDQSIDDQAETATGGLVNDMPGLPMSPPGRGGPPSALGGLASAFQRMMGGQPQRPQAARPGRSPWEAPGQSQLPVMPGQPQRPQIPPSQRWQGTTASLFLPKGAQQPPARFTPWMHGPPTTSHEQWGQEDQYPDLPQPFETHGLYQNTSKFFGQNGSPAIAMLALSMGKNAGAFIDGVMKGQEWKAKMHRQQMQDDANELYDKQQKEMYTYFDTVDEYASAAGVGKAGDVGNYAIKGVTLLDALGQEATKLGDDKLLAVLGTGSVDKALAFLHQRNDNWKTLGKANAATAKQDEEDAADAEYGVPPDPARAANPANNFGQRPSATQPQPSAVAGGGPAPTLSPGQQQGQQDQPPPAQPTDSANNDKGPTQQQLKPYQQIGLEAARGNSEMAGLPKRVQQYARDYQSQVEGGMDNVLAHSEGKSRDQIYKELQRVSPTIADEWTGLLDGNVGLPGGVAATGAKPYWRDLAALSIKVKPTWSATDFPRRAELNKEYDAGPTGRRMSRVESMSAAGKALLRALNDVGPDEKPPTGAIEAWLAKSFTGDPKWGRVFSAYNTYVQEAQSIASQTGNFHEGDVNRVMRETPYTSGPSFLRGMVSKDAETARDTIDDLNSDYKTVVGRDALHYNQKAVADLAAIASYDPKSGRFTGPVPPDMQGLDGGSAGGGQVHDWRDYFK